MKATLEYNLPEEQEDFDYATNGFNYYMALVERLPTKEEMEEIYENKNKLDGFISPVYVSDNGFFMDNNVYYWSGSSYGSDYVWVIGFIDKFVAITLKTGYLYTRAVKTSLND